MTKTQICLQESKESKCTRPVNAFSLRKYVLLNGAFGNFIAKNFFYE